MKSIALCGFYGKNNMGDDLMQHHLATILQQGNPKKLTIFSDCNSGSAQNGLRSDRFMNSSTIFIGGGGIIEPDFWAFRDGRLQEMLIEKKEVVFLNVSVYESLKQNLVFQEQLRLLNAEWIVRDNRSATILSSIGIESLVVPDVAFSYTSESQAGGLWGKDYIAQHFKTPDDDDNVMLFYPNYYAFAKNFGGNNTFEDSIKYMSFTLNMARFIDWMASFGWKTFIMPAQTDKYIDDRLIGAAIYAQVRIKELVTWIPDTISFAHHESAISRVKLILSMRYHASVLAIKNNIPCIDILHHDKNRGLWEDVGLSRLLNESQAMNTVNCNAAFTVNSLISAAEYLKHNESQYKLKTAEYTSSAGDKWDLIKSRINKLTNEAS